MPDLPDLEVSLTLDLSGFQQAMERASQAARAMADQLGPMFESTVRAINNVSGWYTALTPEEREQLAAMVNAAELSELGTGMEK